MPNGNTKTTSRRELLRLFTAGAGASILAPLALPASGQPTTWPPAKPVSLIIGTPAGGAIDAYARVLAQYLGKVTGGTFIVDYKPGVNGNISADYVRQAPADGATLWIGTQAMVTINPSVYPNQRWKPADFQPLSKGVESPLVLVVHPSVPAQNLKELTQWLHTHPDQAAYASFSAGTPSHFLGYQLSQRLKIDMTHVPYKGSGPQTTDLLGGQVMLGFGQLQSVLPHVQSGRLRAIAVTSPKRSRHLPQVPTLAELGYGDLETTIWFGLLAPVKCPKPMLDAMAAATRKVQADPEYRANLEGQGFDVPQESGEAFAATIARETARWSEVVRATGFRAND